VLCILSDVKSGSHDVEKTNMLGWPLMHVSLTDEAHTTTEGAVATMNFANKKVALS
jgi:hypothetical protein